MSKLGNTQLGKAKRQKKDEFYTRLEDIERELAHYKEHFKGKTVLCNCDDPRVSNFFHYFSYQFERLGLKRLITTCYKNQERDLFSQNNSERAIWLEYTGDKNGNRIPDPEEIGIRYLNGDGDFRSTECVELLKQADIVVTNPPFSLFSEYIAQLMKYGKKFVIIGHQNAITYKDVFPHIMANKVWLGYGFKRNCAHFINSHYEDTASDLDHREGMIRVSGVTWYTNLDIPKIHEEIILWKDYTSEDNPKYDNYNAIEVSKTSEIPKDQREFIYSEKQQQAVINTAMHGYPLNTMYWAVRGDGTYEVIDGQQRTLSICRFREGDFSFAWRESQLFFDNLQLDEQKKFLDYRLMVYLCEGTESEKLEWFRTINIAGEELTEQELRNAVYAGPWTADAKRHFSKTECAAFQLGGKYMTGSPIRQDYLETAIRWFANGDIEGYMAAHQHDASATALWVYFQNVIAWVRTLFPKYRREMKGVDWGVLYNEFKNGQYDPAAMEKDVQRLMADDDVTKKSGIYEYLLSGGERENALSIRKFTDSQKRAAYERQGGLCADCGKHFDFEEMHGDHKTPWSKGGHSVPENLQMLCRTCNLKKGDK